MHYLVVYDVLNDGFPWFGVFFAVVPLLLAVAFVLEFLERVRGKKVSASPAPACGLEVMPIPLLIVAILILTCAGCFVASKTYEGYVHQQECKEWARTGQYQITEGTVADYHFLRVGANFRVADSSFDLMQNSAGFTGRFNIPGAPEDLLREGSRVRLAHQDGCILRVEVAP